MATKLYRTLALAGIVGLASAAAHATTVDVNAQSNFTFSPATVNIQVGDSVRFSNPSAGFHNVTADDGSFRCAAGCDAQGGDPASSTWSFTRTFNSPGTFGYHCEVHGSPGGGMHGTIVVAPLAEEHHGSLQFSTGSYSVTEGTAKASITVTRTGGDDGPVSVSYAATAGTATAGGDFTATSGTLSWADHDDSSKVFQVSITNDTAVEPNETVNLALSSPTGGAVLGTANATLTIHDNDTGGTTPPAAPAKLVSTATSGGSVSLSWQDKSGNETLFRVQHRRLTELTFTADDTTAANQHDIVVSGLDAATPYVFRVRAENSGGNSAFTDELIATTDTTPAICPAGANTLCIGGPGDRFRVDVSWRTHSQSGSGGAVPLPANPDSGLFYFFSSGNIETLIKVLNACASSAPRYWVFFAATTNVEFTLSVTDTSTGKMKTYFNPIDHAALPVQDTEAFATCP